MKLSNEKLKMLKKSIYTYKQVKDIAYKAIKANIDTPVIFRQLQYQSALVFLPSEMQPNVIKTLLDKQNTDWHFIVIADDYMLNLTKKDKEYGTKNN